MAREAEYRGLSAKRCDSCKSSLSVLFCRADAAYLCGACDCRVHAANALASRHERVWLCEVCEHAPASVTCKADAATLCATCDAEIHAANPLARRHERVPVVPFYDPVSPAVKPSSAAVGAAASIFCCGEVDDEQDQSEAATWMKAKGMMTETAAAGPDLNFFRDVDPYLDLDYADSLVPVQGKPVAGSSGFGGGAPPMMVPNGVVEFDFALGKPSCSSYNAHSLSHSMSSSEVGVVPGAGGGSAMADVSNPYGLGQAPNPTAAATMDREARVMRYREKRKNRKFEKTIRYASRKAYAEARPRIKGRFAKRVEMDADADPIYSSASAAAAFMVDINGYGVVPSF